MENVCCFFFVFFLFFQNQKLERDRAKYIQPSTHKKKCISWEQNVLPLAILTSSTGWKEYRWQSCKMQILNSSPATMMRFGTSFPYRFLYFHRKPRSHGECISAVSSLTVSQYMLEGLWYKREQLLTPPYIHWILNILKWPEFSYLFVYFKVMDILENHNWKYNACKTWTRNAEQEIAKYFSLLACHVTLANYLENNNKLHSNTETNWKLGNCTKLTAQSWFSESKQIMQWWKQLKCRSQSSATSLFKWLRLEIVFFPGM